MTGATGAIIFDFENSFFFLKGHKKTGTIAPVAPALTLTL